MKVGDYKDYRSHGDGRFELKDFRSVGRNVIFESGVLVFHPENIVLGENIYVGHGTVLKGYHKNLLSIGDHTWIGQGCFFHSAGGLTIGKGVGIGPGVKILTSVHEESGDLDLPVMFNALEFKPVVLEDGCDIGMGSILLPGVTIGEGAIIGAGAVVTHDVPPLTVAAGVPAKVLRQRERKARS